MHMGEKLACKGLLVSLGVVGGLSLYIAVNKVFFCMINSKDFLLLIVDMFSCSKHYI